MGQITEKSPRIINCLHWFSSSCVSYGASFSGCTCHRCSGRVSSSCSTSGTHRVSLVTNPVISREWGKDREMFTTSGTYPWSFVIQIFHNGQTGHVKFSKWNENVIKGLMSNLWFSGFFQLFDPTSEECILSVTIVFCTIFLPSHLDDEADHVSRLSTLFRSKLIRPLVVFHGWLRPVHWSYPLTKMGVLSTYN
jgi:hypothetical protein